MNHRNCFEALDKSLRDLLSENDDSVEGKLFGDKTMVLGGDFRQILPVIVGESRQDIIDAPITKSYIWNNCKVFRLLTNMRLLQCLFLSRPGCTVPRARRQNPPYTREFLRYTKRS
uniref:ATP-dependent DNA helicase n=1 Tax=Ananas comosus var. bracteatus TaxID=296719 RepID=A0A6V7PG19_ANACO|nr:unnamed protein product [Ananas comosus var. bracteatus]